MISNSAKYWIWITLALGFNNTKIKYLINVYENIEEFYSGNEFEWIFCGIFSQKELSALKRTKLSQAEEIIDKCRALGYSVISVDDALYPQRLRDIDAPPAVLYVSGNMPFIDDMLSISVVGTRKASVYGIKTAYEIAYNLSKCGAVVVSGGALGVDSASHKGALQADGCTVCVLGCGINYNYLPENASMRKAITSKGAVISEYPPDYSPKPYHFPARNRIISALSNGVLVIEAGLKSGSLITAGLALEQGKEVFAVMGNINSPLSKGSNKLIKDGAIPVTDYTDILNAFENVYATKGNPQEYISSYEEIDVIPVKGKAPSFLANVKTNDVTHNNQSKKKVDNNSDIIEEETALQQIIGKAEVKYKDDSDLSDNAKIVYHILNTEPMHIDDISIKSKLPVFKILQTLTELEMMGLIESQQGRMYKIV